MSFPTIKLYNTLTQQKEEFIPINSPLVGMYVCGPTVYNIPHIGNVRTAVSFDLLFRYLKYVGYKVRYVRNITDVGHLENDSDDGEDKLLKQSRLQQLEPMEVAQYYTDMYNAVMEKMNVSKPSIEPRATGHIIEQIEMIEQIVNNGYGYVSNGSVYFDVNKYHQQGKKYELSGRIIEDLIANTRELEAQDEKRNPLDFALWKNAQPEHIMRWNSPWGVGFPGWHIECSAMSKKYLGEQFDIHGGGIDLTFPHHECEIAQSEGATGKNPVNYWMHANMLTMDGKKMGKSLGNSIYPTEFFTGNHPLLEQAYSPMTIRFFFLQAQYRSTLDFSNTALKASEKAYKKVINAWRFMNTIVLPTQYNTPSISLEKRIQDGIKGLYDGMNDDMNSAVSIAHLFDLVKVINSIRTGQIDIADISATTLQALSHHYIVFVRDILGLLEEKGKDTNMLEDLMETILHTYTKAKEIKDYTIVDIIRSGVKKQGILLKDGKTSNSWDYEES